MPVSLRRRLQIKKCRIRICSFVFTFIELTIALIFESILLVYCEIANLRKKVQNLQCQLANENDIESKPFMKGT